MRTGLLLLASTLLMLGSARADDAARMPMSMSTDPGLQLRQNMRQLWMEHVVWTRDYVVAALNDAPDTKAVSERLLRNQEDIGKAIVPYYGQEAGSQLTQLLKQHILIAVDLVAAAKAGDQAKVKDADMRWHDNAADLGAFLSKANPNWPKESMVNMLNQHLALTADEATLRLQKKWTEAIANFDQIMEQGAMMADMFSDGILRQFPEKFRMAPEPSATRK